MNPALVSVLIAGAKEIFTSSKAFKENVRTKSTAAAVAVGTPVTATTLLAPETVGLSPDHWSYYAVNLLNVTATLILFLYRKKQV